MGFFSNLVGISISNTSPEFQQLASRWDAFLKKLDERYHEILQQTADPMDSVIDNLQYDTIIIHNILTALHNQTVEQLSKKVDDGWMKMHAEMDKINAAWSDVGAQRSRGGAFKQYMRNEYDRFEMETYARAARKILANVQAHIDEKKMHRCTQCGAELPIKVYSFMAVNLKCESCGSVNTYQPDDRVRALEYYVINKLADEFAYTDKMNAKFDNSKIKDYYQKYYGYLMENVPDKKEFYERAMNEDIRKMTQNPSFFSDQFLN